ncbi:MAG: C4-dicarboxylate ABC transporter substrate-binding protein [Deltaproteobacteria bacterium]|nr:MAG: C4-dicarboxylate ABC transporter substrate-binding protein [Deltaproteobacteria bacterium]
MKRLVISISILAMAIAASVTAAFGATTLTYANFPPAPTFPCVQMEEWKKKVEAATEGKVKVDTFPGSTLLGAKNMMDGVIDGIADIGCLAFPYQPGRFPLLEGVDLPIGFTNSKVANAVLWDLFVKYNPESLKKVKVLALFTAPPADIMSKDPIRKIEDLKGYELRATGAGVKPLELLGAIPVAMPMSETPDALQKGVVKGVLSSTDILKDFKFAETCKFVTDTNFQTTAFGVVMNMDKWNALPDDVKKVFDGLAKEHSMWTGKYVDDHGDESIAWSKENHNLEVISLTATQYKEWHDMMSPITDAWLERTSAKDLPAKEFLADLLSLKEKYEAEYAK